MRYIDDPILGKLPKIALGCDRFGDEVEEKIALGEIEAYLEAGGYLLDTAHAYGQKTEGGPSSSEILLGKFLSTAPRESIFLATKGGLSKSKATRLDRTSLTEDIEMSLDHLKTTPDLWFFHRDNPSMPVEELIDTALNFKKQGYLKHIGVSNWSVDRIEKANNYLSALGEEPIAAVENQFSYAYCSREIWGEADAEFIGSERAPYEWFEKSGIPTLCFSSQGRGILQKLLKGEKTFGKASRFVCEENQRRAEKIGRISQETGYSVTDLNLAYVLSKKANFIAIIGSYNVENIKASMTVQNLVLDDELMKRLEE